MLRKALMACIAFSYASSAVAKNNIEIRYLEPKNQLHTEIEAAIRHSDVNQTIVELSNQLFPFNQALTVEYGGDQGPLYNPETHVVHIPYSFYQEALSYFKQNKYDQKYGKSAKAGTMDTILHTLLHEVGHAYIADQAIPVLGKEEDAVDNFAAIIMIEYLNDGADAAISAADMFAFESAQRPDYYDFGEYIDEHSFDLQRYFSTLCLIYGSDPEQHQSLLDEVENDYLADRQDFCQFQYQATSQSWHHYLKGQRADQ
ncbi:hypothetical protein FCU94_17180 [Vibrio sp. JPW-9-11-11]|uniref:DUF4344 domain-containing metallopeptidase n=1 Tax=Vibrio sp. JPW-9-11-11 TaxID=1416532 RepID=UPI001593F549|nr:DUF4344 domain-containing metallopeptidase [Vibrio sp. JPW-9-11-11]NVD08581.1 hypothetical protein [Vibrio sp. JPW-9-11-11]